MMIEMMYMSYSSIYTHSVSCKKRRWEMSMITYVIRVYMKNQISHVLCKKSVFLFKKSES